jgi:hypothetical protein
MPEIKSLDPQWETNPEELRKAAIFPLSRRNNTGQLVSDY